MAEFNDKKVALSEFNEASLQILRLNNWWNNCFNNLSKGNLKEAKWLLDIIWNELYADAIRRDSKSRSTNHYVLKNKLLCKKINVCKNKDETYELLNERIQFLKDLQDAVGKGTKRAETYDDNFMV